VTRRWIAELAWLGGEDLERDVFLEVEDGHFVTVTPNVTDEPGSRLPGVTLPGMVNTHSHAFHRKLRGRTHRKGGDFWIWRDLMYQVAADLTPESYEEIATNVYAEMVGAGFTTVGEFHYVHHQMGGRPYHDPNEMGHVLIRAARRAGIRIALLDAGYFTAGLDGSPLSPVQMRFSDVTVDSWLERVASLADSYRDQPDVRVGLAPHSVRAVPESYLATLVEQKAPDITTHIHVSEQPTENQVCRDITGVTPVGLLDRVGMLGPNTTVIHATHLTDLDIDLLGGSHTRVCYCATTERELADGIGPAASLHAAGSSISIGSDSHAVIDPFEEARGLELHNRLATGRRGGFEPEYLLEAATRSGAAALGFETVGLVVGANADFITVSSSSPRTSGLSPDQGAAQIVFAATSADVTDVFVAGNRIDGL
jgi:formiminoglutamate deiminase